MEPTKQELTVSRPDLQKIYDVLAAATEHHEQRDRMNASLHLAREVRFSPLTSELAASRDRIASILDADG